MTAERERLTHQTDKLAALKIQLGQYVITVDARLDIEIVFKPGQVVFDDTFYARLSIPVLVTQFQIQFGVSMFDCEKKKAYSVGYEDQSRDSL